MMFLSTLLINTGTNPDQPRPGRLWLRNVYRVHQRLCMAFPSKAREKKDVDPDFLKSYDPADFPENRFQADKKPAEVGREVLAHVHAKRNADAGFLFRIDPQPGGRAVIVVLSAIEPDWNYAFHNACHLLSAAPQKPRLLQVAIESGKCFHFRLLANPTMRAPLTKQQWLEKKAAKEHIKRKRFQLKWETGDDPEKVFAGWLDKRAAKAGFKLHEVKVGHIGYAYIHKGHDTDKGQRLRSVQYDGILEVTDPAAFRQTLACGIGPAKAFGFGLLSIAPAG